MGLRTETSSAREPLTHHQVLNPASANSVRTKSRNPLTFGNGSFQKPAQKPPSRFYGDISENLVLMVPWISVCRWPRCEGWIPLLPDNQGLSLTLISARTFGSQRTQLHSGISKVHHYRPSPRLRIFWCPLWISSLPVIILGQCFSIFVGIEIGASLVASMSWFRLFSCFWSFEF